MLWVHLFWRAEDPSWLLRGCKLRCLPCGFCMGACGVTESWLCAHVLPAPQHQGSSRGCCPKISVAPWSTCSSLAREVMPEARNSPAFSALRSQLDFLSCFCNSMGKGEIKSLTQRVPTFSSSPWLANLLARYLRKLRDTAVSQSQCLVEANVVEKQ